MELLRIARNPWGQEAVIGASWELLWWFIAAAAAFIVAHGTYLRLARSRRGQPPRADEQERFGVTSPQVASARPGEPAASSRIVRHRGSDRLYHWLMAAMVLTLVGTGLLPLFGVKFGWVAPHWIAGLVLTVLIAFHVVRATIWEDVWAMIVVPADVRDAWRRLRQALGQAGAPPGKPGKYPLLQKFYHGLIALVVVGTVVTGLLMMVKIDTPFWTRNPYWLTERTWGVIYVVHDLTSMMTVSLIMVHIYFGLRPEKLWRTRAMIRGWITRREYLDHHDPKRWDPERASAPRGGANAQLAVKG
jgi:cytochrome b subunit of formate dehydrogenase